MKIYPLKKYPWIKGGSKKRYPLKDQKVPLDHETYPKRYPWIKGGSRKRYPLKDQKVPWITKLTQKGTPGSEVDPGIFSMISAQITVPPPLKKYPLSGFPLKLRYPPP